MHHRRRSGPLGAALLLASWSGSEPTATVWTLSPIQTFHDRQHHVPEDGRSDDPHRHHTIHSHWDLLERLCLERTTERALSYAERRQRAFNPALSVLAHGDAHQGNTLVAPDSITGFKLADPDGAFAERAFDLAIMMREWGKVMPQADMVRLGHNRCGQLAKFSGVGHQSIWEWGLIQCVWNGLLLHRIGLNEPASVLLAVADAWSAAGDIVAP